MDAIAQVVSGVLVAAVERAYKPFRDQQTNEERPGGVTYSVWLGVSFDAPPVEIRVTEPAVFGELKGIGRGQVITVTCELGARGNKVTRRAIRVEHNPANGARPATTAAR